MLYPFYFIFTIFNIIYCFFVIGISPLFFLPWGIFKLFKNNRLADSYMEKLSALWARLIVWSWFLRLKVTGKENIPSKDEKVCFIANHQSLTDVMIIEKIIPRMVGFIAKKELAKNPIFYLWMAGAKCVPLDRKNPRLAMKDILKGIELIKQGYAQLIFPEGTRSGGQGLREFKKGSFKLAYKSDATIVPITIDGSYRIISKHILVKPFSKINIVIHPPIKSSDLSEEEKNAFSTKMWEIINSGFETPFTEVLPPKNK